MKHKTINFYNFTFRSTVLALCSCLAITFFCAADVGAVSNAQQTVSELRAALAERVDAQRYADFEDPAVSYFNEHFIRALLQSSDTELQRRLDEVVSWNYDIPFGSGGEALRIYEAFTLRSWIARQRRAVLFLNGSVFVGNNFSLPAEGYDAMAMVASRGMFAFALDYVGTGASYLPANGADADFEENTAAAYSVVWYIRNFRLVRQIDLYGEGYGGAIATQLAADKRWIRSCVMSAMLYSELAGGPLSDPNFIDYLEHVPDGYIYMPPESYLIFASQTPLAVQEYLQSTQSGFYPTPNLLSAAYLPFYDPSVSRVPGLAIYGELDNVGGPHDATDLAAAYGRHGADLVILEGAGHAPRTESLDVVTRYWDLIFDFWGF